MAFLAVSLRKNHRDLWLQDFLKAPFSSLEAGLLQQAIQQNYTGNAKQAYLDAARASKEFPVEVILPASFGVNSKKSILSDDRRTAGSACVKPQTSCPLVAIGGYTFNGKSRGLSVKALLVILI